jgi:hypothetical protein
VLSPFTTSTESFGKTSKCFFNILTGYLAFAGRISKTRQYMLENLSLPFEEWVRLGFESSQGGLAG